MNGKVYERKDIKGNSWFYIKYPWSSWPGRAFTVSWYRGLRMRTEEDANRLLHQIQGEEEKGTLNPLTYTKGESDIVEFLHEWLDECKGDWTPGTQKLYGSYVRNHLEPFFRSKTYQLNSCRGKAIQELKTCLEKKTRKIKLPDGTDKEVRVIAPEYVKKVVDCLGSALHYAWRCEIIDYPPPLPKKKAYQITEKKPRATTEAIQDEIIGKVPIEHQAVLLFMKYHPEVRPSSVMMLNIADYDNVQNVFIVRRGISGGQEVEYTKTKKEQKVPCHSKFKPILEKLVQHREYVWSPYLFTCKESRHMHHRYTKEILDRIIHMACKDAGVKINLYSLMKHTGATKYLKDLQYSPEQVKILLGLSSTQMVYKYMDVDLEVKRQLMEGNVVPLRNASVTQNQEEAIEEKQEVKG